MFYVTLNPSIPTGNEGGRYTHIWCKAIDLNKGDGTVEMLGFNQGSVMVVPSHVAEGVPTILAVNADPRLEAFKPDNTGDVEGHLVL